MRLFSFLLNKGYKSLEELSKKDDLTFQQKIGIKYYNDINEKMQREEVARIETHVCKDQINLNKQNNLNTYENWITRDLFK